MAQSRLSVARLYLAVAVAVCFLFIGRTDLIRMEPIIASGARHMVEGGSWFVPELYGEIYAFKPALAYWMAAAAGSMFGWSEWSLRLPTALCGVLLGLSICLVMGRLVSPRCGLVSGVAAVLSCLFIEQARIVGFEMPMALGVGVATLAAVRNLSRAESDLGWWALGYLGLLFGFLAKGLPAVVFYAAGLLAAVIVLRQARLLWRWQHLVGVGILALGASAYLVLAIRDGGPAVLTQHLVEIVFRGTRWTPRAMLAGLLKPAVMFAAFLPGSALLLLRFSRRPPSGDGSSPPGLRLAAWAFLLAGVILFVVSAAKNTRYYLPLVTPMAILAGVYADSFRFPLPESSQTTRRARVIADPAAWMFLAGSIYWIIFVSVVEPTRCKGDSLRDVAMQFGDRLGRDETVYVDTQDSYSSLFWYLGRPVRVWHLERPPPATPACVVLVDKQIEAAHDPRGLRFTLVHEARDWEGRRYALYRLEAGP